jgi:hypothetical protein
LTKKTILENKAHKEYGICLRFFSIAYLNRGTPLAKDEGTMLGRGRAKVGARTGTEQIRV